MFIRTERERKAEEWRGMDPMRPDWIDRAGSQDVKQLLQEGSEMVRRLSLSKSEQQPKDVIAPYRPLSNVKHFAPQLED